MKAWINDEHVVVQVNLSLLGRDADSTAQAAMVGLINIILSKKPEYDPEIIDTLIDELATSLKQECRAKLPMKEKAKPLN